MSRPTLFHLLNGWLHPLSFSTFLITCSQQWDYNLGPSKAIMTRANKIDYVQFGQLGVVIEDSRWQLLYLVVTQFPKRRYSLISVKRFFFFLEIVSIAGFLFHFFCWIDSFICVVPGSNTRLCYNPDVFVIFWYLSALLAQGAFRTHRLLNKERKILRRNV